MSWEAWFTLSVVLVIVAVLARDLLPPSVAIGGGSVALLAAGIIDPGEALSGFSNPATATIAALFVVAAAVSKTGALTPLVRGVLGDGSSERQALARLTVPTAAASAFLNNTPIVAMLIPQVERWAEARGLSPSKFLMPLSFAAILGGVVTLMGTATNIVVSGLLEADGFAPLGFFEITKIGLPVAVVGLIVILSFAPRILPARRQPSTFDDEEFRRFNVTMRTLDTLDGKSVDQAGLRHLRGVFLAQIERDNELITPVTPETVLHADDVLRFVGRVDDIVDLTSMPGLASTEHKQMQRLDAGDIAHFEAVIGPSSPLSGTTLRAAGFRNRYQAVVTAIHRAGQRLDAKLGDVVLRPGDTLLVVADREWGRRWRERPDFALIARLGAAPPTPGRKAPLTGVVVAAMVLLAATGVLPLVTAALLGAAAMLVLRIVTPAEAGSAVDLDVIITIAAAFGLAAAMHASGLADAVATWMISASAGLGPVATLAGVVLTTVVLKELITNKAAALLILPIALAGASSAGLNPRAFAIAVAVAAGTPVLTPIGYQTNLMVYGPGRYRYADYLRLGVPLTAAIVAVLLVGIPILWPL